MIPLPHEAFTGDIDMAAEMMNSLIVVMFVTVWALIGKFSLLKL